MYVGWSMKTNLITISPDTSIFKAREMMTTHRISHLPVTDGKAHLLGIVTDRDLKQAWASPATTLSVHELTYVLQKLTAANVMTKDVITGTPDMTIERAARIMFDNKIGALPIVKDDRLVGLITTSDLTEILLTALGMSDDSKRLSLLVKDRIGVLAEVGKHMAEAHINIRSVLFVPLRGHADYWQLILRVNQTNFQSAVQVLKEAGFKVVVDYVEDPTPYLET
ncbi:CBS and ACT domain-containing protein [Desulforhabdus amnigena]|jgi:acetoin utilization protein AcuB|uniref:Signal transduction protein n=1 Tax=Desulforhabdus amnigena TaxID=40218 RepID=A0A9W6FU71_9BACT|nr:CBS and ACT domain-containing protein [Desulforhabdus amnigena]NLJ27436.1 CBS domain-containing protein [Deltaproteobacteria bacterium]GLI34961.1 signal transduction protein [Desulforhabdus amnigena]